MANFRDGGFTGNRKRVQRLMRLMDIAASCLKPRTSNVGKGYEIYPYLLRGLGPEQPNQAWVADITYITMTRGSAYLVAVMDLYSWSWFISLDKSSRV